jgi:hypothetical protein
VSGFALTV